MFKIKCFCVELIIIIFYVNIFIITMNAKNIIFGKLLIDMNGSLKVPVFVPISWLIHDIESAKLIGQKSDFTNKDLKEDMMTSDMTPDINGNFNRESKRDVYEGQDSRKHITNRVSDSHTTSESITDMDEGITTEMVPTNKEPALKQTIKDDLFTNSDMRLALESNRYKWLAKKQLDEEIMYSPEVWRKQEDPLFTTIEVYELPGANKYMGLASNRTVVHKAPEVQPTVPSKTQMLKNNVKVSENSKNNYYFKNVLNRRALKTKKWF